MLYHLPEGQVSIRFLYRYPMHDALPLARARDPFPGSRDAAARQRWVEVGLVFAFWTFMALLMASGRLLDARGNELQEGQAIREVLRAFSNYYVWALLTPAIFWMGRRFSIERSTWRWHIPLHLAAAVVVAISADIYDDFLRANLLFGFGRHPFVFDPIRDIQRLWFLNELIIYFAVLAAAFARDYFLRYRARVQEADRLRAELAEARLETLRMQLNPHFLFNTLHAVSTLVERDPRGVRRMIARLSTLLRYTLEGTHAQEVPLGHELSFLRDYLEIQQIRFQGRLEVREDVAADVQEALLPSLILQPIVENALKHGVSKTDGVGLIELRAWRAGVQLCISVRDNGPGLDEALATTGDGAADPAQVPTNGVGLRNTQARLRGLYGDDQTLTFRPAEGGGLVVTLTLPYHTAADLHTSAVARV